MNLKPRHVIGVALLGLIAFIATARLTRDSSVLMGVGVAWLCCIQITMNLHVAGLRKRLSTKSA